jgi:hypothetical protein
MSYGNIVLATSRSSWVSKCIRFFTSSKFSHSFVTMPSLLGFPMCIEAESGGVDMARFDLNYSNNQDEAYEVWVVNLPQATVDAALSSVISDLEEGYGFLQYPWFVWRALNRLLGRDIKAQNNWNTSGMICSRLVVAYLKAAGLQSALAGYGDGSIAPQDLRDIMAAHPQLFTLSNSVRM